MRGWNPGWNLLTKEQQREALKQSIAAHLTKSYLRMQFRNGALIPGLLKNYSIDYLAEYMAEMDLPPDNPEEEQIQQLADLLIHRLYPDKKIAQIIFMAMPQIKEAYKEILKSGGGWSVNSNRERRKKAVLEWYRRNQARLERYKRAGLPYIKEEYLQDAVLYRTGGGQEKRDFIYRLLMEIVKAETKMKLTFEQVNDYLKKLDKIIKQPLRLEDL